MLAPRHAFLLGALAVITRGFDVRVNTSFGPLIGQHGLFSACDSWVGIPFAEPPVGELRFAAPEPWSRAFPARGRQAKKPGPACFQVGIIGDDGAEDCLYLNVWRPHGVKSSAGLAVMVWIYGGAFAIGAGDSSIIPLMPDEYTGCRLVSTQKVIFVSFNYRLGPLGFGTFQGEGGELQTNFGVQDQRAALRWVQEQVRHFGGDPGKVTIFGESAGGISVFHHTVSPLSRGLFRAGIAESGFPYAMSPRDALRLTAQMATNMGCANTSAGQLACLRSKAPRELLKGAEVKDPVSMLMSLMPWAPVQDGVDLPEHPLVLINQGKSHVSALMAGTNTNEGNMFIWPTFPFGLNETAFKTWASHLWNNDMAKLTPAEMDRVFSMYPAQGSDVRPVASDLFTDVTFLCATHEAMRLQSKHTDAFVYRFNWVDGCLVPYILSGIPGVFHGLEIPYVFGDPLHWGCASWGPRSAELSDRMMRMWGDFAKHLDPSHSSPGAFPKYTAEFRENKVFQGEDATEWSYRADYCQLWEDVLFSKILSPSGGPISELPSGILV